jgi:preprotein translocase subunit SecD
MHLWILPMLSCLGFFLFSSLSFSENIHDYAPVSMAFKTAKDEFILDNAAIQNAYLVRNKNGSFEGLHITLKPAAAKNFTLLTTKNIGKTMSIIFNKKIISTFTIQSPLVGNFQLSNVTKQEAQEFLASLIA